MKDLFEVFGDVLKSVFGKKGNMVSMYYNGIERLTFDIDNSCCVAKIKVDYKRERVISVKIMGVDIGFRGMKIDDARNEIEKFLNNIKILEKKELCNKFPRKNSLFVGRITSYCPYYWIINMHGERRYLVPSFWNSINQSNVFPYGKNLFSIVSAYGKYNRPYMRTILFRASKQPIKIIGNKKFYGIIDDFVTGTFVDNRKIWFVENETLENAMNMKGRWFPIFVEEKIPGNIVIMDSGEPGITIGTIVVPLDSIDDYVEDVQSEFFIF